MSPYTIPLHHRHTNQIYFHNISPISERNILHSSRRELRGWAIGRLLTFNNNIFLRSNYNLILKYISVPTYELISQKAQAWQPDLWLSLVTAWTVRLRGCLEEERADHWSLQGAERAGFRKVSEPSGRRRTASSQSPTPGAAWSWPSYSGTRSSPGSPTVWGWSWTLLVLRLRDTASHCISSPGRSVAEWWKVFVVSCWLYASWAHTWGEEGLGPALASHLQH